MRFKFLQNNENILFNNAIIDACENYYVNFIENRILGITSNRQHTISGLGTFFIVDYEFCYEDNSHYSTINFTYETLQFPKLIFRYKNEKLMCLTLTYT